MKDFTKIKEKGVPDCDRQQQPVHLLELFGGIGAPRRALENTLEKMIRETGYEPVERDTFYHEIAEG